MAYYEIGCFYAENISSVKPDLLRISLSSPIPMARRLHLAHIINTRELEAVSKLHNASKIDQAAILSYILYDRIFQDPKLSEIIEKIIVEENYLTQPSKWIQQKGCRMEICFSLALLVFYGQILFI